MLHFVPCSYYPEIQEASTLIFLLVALVQDREEVLGQRRSETGSIVNNSNQQHRTTIKQQPLDHTPSEKTEKTHNQFISRKQK